MHICDTFCLYPKHCAPPTVISEHDRTLLAADDILQSLDIHIQPNTRHKLEHAHIMQQLHDLLHKCRDNNSPPRVAPNTQPPPRVTPTTHPTDIQRLLRVTPTSHPTTSQVPPRVNNPPTSKQALQQIKPHHPYNTHATAPPDNSGDDINIHQPPSPQLSVDDKQLQQQSPQPGLDPTRRSKHIALQAP